MGLGLVIFLGFFFLRKRRSRQYQGNRVSGNKKIAPLPRVEQGQVLEVSAEQQWQLDGSARYEIDGNSRSELEARRSV